METGMLKGQEGYHLCFMLVRPRHGIGTGYSRAPPSAWAKLHAATRSVVYLANSYPVQLISSFLA